MTCTRRPEIVDRTLSTFRAGLLGTGPDHRLVANLDPVGGSKADGKAVCTVLAHHFGDQVLLRQPRSPSFPGALRWCWEQVEGDYIFGLEDDWELQVELDLADMLTVMEEHPWLAALRLPKRETRETECRQSASTREPLYQWNGRYWGCPKGRTAKNGYYGSPSLLRVEWVRGVRGLLTENASPEKQLRRLREKHNPAVWCWEYGVYSKPNTPKVIVDIGTAWRKTRGLRKNSQRNFTRWEPQGD